MELKDMILSTLAELEVEPQKKEEVHSEEASSTKESLSSLPSGTLKAPSSEDIKEVEQESILEFAQSESSEKTSNEKVFCENLRERILVLFEGFQSPNNKNIEAKVDLTLNFLEYLLATIDERLENLDSK